MSTTDPLSVRLVELIVLNVGLSANILSPRVFSMFVLEVGRFQLILVALLGTKSTLGFGFDLYDDPAYYGVLSARS